MAEEDKTWLQVTAINNCKSRNKLEIFSFFHLTSSLLSALLLWKRGLPRNFAHALCSPVKISVLVNLSCVSILFQSERLDSQLCSRFLCRSVVNACIPILWLANFYLSTWSLWGGTIGQRARHTDRVWCLATNTGTALHNTWLMVSLWGIPEQKVWKQEGVRINTRNCLQAIQECWVTALGWSTGLWALSPVHFDLNICSTITALTPGRPAS